MVTLSNELDPLSQLKPVKWGKIPTPLELRTDIGKDLGVELYIKREDMIDDLGSGHKVRKLEYIIADALKQKSSMLITAGSLQSNQCRSVAIAGKLFGLKVHLVYSGDQQVRPSIPMGNYLLAAIFNSKITWYEKTPWKLVNTLVDTVYQKEILAGEHPYVIPPGASSWPGLLGSIALGYELASQIRGMGISPEFIVAPAGSCGTCVGVKIASSLLGLNWRVLGICIAGSAQEAEAEQSLLLQEAYTQTGLSDILQYRAEYCDDAPRGGYDMHLAEELDTMLDVIVRYQLLFDPNYMLRTYRGLQYLIRSGKIEQGKKVVLLHTGGQFGVFASTPTLINYWKEKLSTVLNLDQK